MASMSEKIDDHVRNAFVKTMTDVGFAPIPGQLRKENLPKAPLHAYRRNACD
jgi:hypothetical protein